MQRYMYVHIYVCQVSSAGAGGGMHVTFAAFEFGFEESSLYPVALGIVVIIGLLLVYYCHFRLRCSK